METSAQMNCCHPGSASRVAAPRRSAPGIKGGPDEKEGFEHHRMHLAVSPEIMVFDGSNASQIPGAAGSCDWRQINGHSQAEICEI